MAGLPQQPSAPPSGLTLDELAARLGARLEVPTGRPAVSIRGVQPLGSAGPEHVSFYANARYKAELAQSRAGAVLVSADEAELVPPGAARLVCAQPYVAFAKASALFHPVVRPPAGVQAGAHVHEGAHVDPSAHVAPGAVVARGARIGPRTVLHPGACVLEEAVVGEGCTLHATAVVRERCLLGDRVVLQPGCVVGSDGFGFAFDLEGDEEQPGPLHRKVPQVGIVRIEDDVELGACTCVDRAALGETVIGRGSKVDNLVQIAHNVQVGPLSLLVAQSGISGSTTLGAGVILAGQVGVVGHLRIGDGVRVGAQSGVSRDLADGETVSGSPAIAHRDWLRMSAALPRLPELLRELRRLARRVEELERAQAARDP
jgi:UDP-3-O-[3-hydroxymyristoyl] glucosamine N-acyltransferase